MRIYLLLTQFKLNCATVLCEYYFKYKNKKRIYNVLFICVATTYDSNVYSSSSVNLLNNLQGGKHDKKKQAK